MERGIELGESWDARGVEYEHGMNHLDGPAGAASNVGVLCLSTLEVEPVINEIGIGT